MGIIERILFGAVAGMVVFVAIVVALTLGIGFLLAAFYMHLAPQSGDAVAALATGGLAFAAAALIAIICAVALRFARRRSAAIRAAKAEARARARAAGGSGKTLSPDELSEGIEAARTWIGTNPGMAGVGALCAGIVLGMNPELNRALGDGIATYLRSERAPSDG